MGRLAIAAFCYYANKLGILHWNLSVTALQQHWSWVLVFGVPSFRQSTRKPPAPGRISRLFCSWWNNLRLSQKFETAAEPKPLIWPSVCLTKSCLQVLTKSLSESSRRLLTGVRVVQLCRSHFSDMLWIWRKDWAPGFGACIPFSQKSFVLLWYGTPFFPLFGFLVVPSFL